MTAKPASPDVAADDLVVAAVAPGGSERAVMEKWMRAVAWRMAKP